MPLYEYRCPRCRTTFELLRPMRRSREPATCPEGHPSAQRVISLVASLGRAGNGKGASTGGCPSCGGGACACGGR